MYVRKTPAHAKAQNHRSQYLRRREPCRQLPKIMCASDERDISHYFTVMELFIIMLHPLGRS